MQLSYGSWDYLDGPKEITKVCIRGGQEGRDREADVAIHEQSHEQSRENRKGRKQILF